MLQLIIAMVDQVGLDGVYYHLSLLWLIYLDRMGMGCSVI